MNTQLVLNRFRVTNIVFSGIAGGVNPSLHVGDVTVPAQWGQYLEVLMARETAPGKYAAPPFITDATLPNFGMMFPRLVEVRSAARPEIQRKFWFEADPKMLEVARSIRQRRPGQLQRRQVPRRASPSWWSAATVSRARPSWTTRPTANTPTRPSRPTCSTWKPRRWAWSPTANGVPYIAFRSLSDLAGGGQGENEMGTFMGIAADNSAQGRCWLSWLRGSERRLRLPPRGRGATVLRPRASPSASAASSPTTPFSLDLQAGEVLALLGENGAGKSTLMSILFGHYAADEGNIEVFGEPLPPGNPKAALAAGVGMVHQHFTLADNLSVLDNVLMGTEPLWRPVSRRAAARARLLDVAQRFGLPVQPDAHIGNLSVGERQRVEIRQGAVPRRAHPDPRRADRRADATGKRGTVRHARADGGTRPVGDLHQPQARRGAARVAPHRRAARRQARGRGAHGRHHAGTAGTVDGRACGRCAAAAASQVGGRCRLRSRPREHRVGQERRARPAARGVADAARRRDHRHRRCFRQRAGGAGRAAVRHAPRHVWHGSADGPRLAALARPAGAARCRAHPGRPACRRRGRRPAGVGERGVGAPAQPGVLALVVDREARGRPPACAAHRKGIRRARRRPDGAGPFALRREHAETDSRAAPCWRPSSPKRPRATTTRSTRTARRA